MQLGMLFTQLGMLLRGMLLALALAYFMRCGGGGHWGGLGLFSGLGASLAGKPPSSQFWCDLNLLGLRVDLKHEVPVEPCHKGGKDAGHDITLEPLHHLVTHFAMAQLLHGKQGALH